MKLLNWFKKFPSIDNPNWQFYTTSDEEEFPLFISCDISYIEPASRKGFNREYIVFVGIPENRFFEGIPVPEEHNFQNHKEDQLCADLTKKRVKCKQVGRVTCREGRFYFFECLDIGKFEKIIEEWKLGFGVEYQIELNDFSPFEKYIDLLPDKFAWMQIENRNLIQKIVQSGSNQSKEHLIEHCIFGKGEKLHMMCAELVKEGFKIITIERDHFIAGILTALNEEQITDQTNLLIHLSTEFDCKYDGWSTGVVK